MLKWQRAKGRSQLVHNFCLRGKMPLRYILQKCSFSLFLVAELWSLFRYIIDRVLNYQ